MWRLLAFVVFFSSNTYAWHYPELDSCVLKSQIAYFLDSRNESGATQAFEQLRNSELQPAPQILHYGYTPGTVWVYLKTNSLETSQKCVFELANPHLDEICAYEVADEKLRLLRVMGDLRPFDERFIQVRNFAFPYRIDTPKEFLFSLKSAATMTVPLNVKWRDRYISESSFDYLMIGLFYGLMLLFVFFGFHSFVSFRNKGYLIYTFFALSMLLFFVDRDGIAFQYFWPDLLLWKAYSVRFFAAVAMALGVLYISWILPVSRPFKAFAYTYVGICVILAVIMLFLPPENTTKATIIVSYGSPLLMILLPLSVLKREKNFAPCILLAGSCSLAGLVLYSLSVTNLISSSLLTENAMKISTVIEFLLISIGIHKKIRATMRKKALHRAVFEVSHMLAHDVRSPLDKMEKFLKRAEKIPDPDLQRYLQSSASSIKEDIRYVDQMLSDLVDMGRKNTVECTELKPILEKSFNGKYSYSLSFTGFVQAGELALKLVFENITKNAFQATRGRVGCSYWVGTEETGKFVRITIGNTGSMIEKDALSKIFGLFYTRGKENSCGIGLAYVKRMIRQCGGQIFVESNGWTSLGKRVSPKYAEDYVEFNMTIPKGSNHGK